MKRNSMTVFWPLSNCFYFLDLCLMSFRLPNKQTIFAVYTIRYMTLNRYCLLKYFHLFEVCFAKLQNRWEIMFEDLTWIFSWKNVCRSELASKKKCVKILLQVSWCILMARDIILSNCLCLPLTFFFLFSWDFVFLPRSRQMRKIFLPNSRKRLSKINRYVRLLVFSTPSNT